MDQCLPKREHPDFLPVPLDEAIPLETREGFFYNGWVKAAFLGQDVSADRRIRGNQVIHPPVRILLFHLYSSFVVQNKGFVRLALGQHIPAHISVPVPNNAA